MPTPLPNPIGTYTTLEDATKGFEEKEKLIGELRSKTVEFEKKIEELSKPKPPAFSDTKGLEKHLADSGIGLEPIIQKAVLESKYDDTDMAKIGRAIKQGDDSYVGRQFAELTRHAQISKIDSARTGATKQLGGEERVRAYLDYANKLPKDDPFRNEFERDWSHPDRATAALERLAGRYLSSTNIQKPTSETSGAGPGSSSGGFSSPMEIRLAREKSKATYGPDYFNHDPEFKRKLAATPEAIKRQPI